MAVQPSASPQNPAASAFAGNFATGSGSPGGGLPIFSGSNLPWSYVVNPGRLECRGGRILPVVGKVWHEPGFGANAVGDSEGGMGFFSNVRASAPGTLIIPHDRPATAWGVLRDPATYGPPHGSTYMVCHRGRTAGGSDAYQWSDAWARPVPLGAIQATWKQDLDGRDRWLETCLDLICPNGHPTDEQITIAIRPTIEHCRHMQDRNDPRGQRALRIAVLHLPEEHVPADLRGIYDDARGVAAEVAGKAARRGRAKAPEVIAEK
jgi:hypothetical protein